MRVPYFPFKGYESLVQVTDKWKYTTTHGPPCFRTTEAIVYLLCKLQTWRKVSTPEILES